MMLLPALRYVLPRCCERLPGRMPNGNYRVLPASEGRAARRPCRRLGIA